MKILGTKDTLRVASVALAVRPCSLTKRQTSKRLRQLRNPVWAVLSVQSARRGENANHERMGREPAAEPRPWNGIRHSIRLPVGLFSPPTGSWGHRSTPAPPGVRWKSTRIGRPNKSEKSVKLTSNFTVCYLAIDCLVVCQPPIAAEGERPIFSDVVDAQENWQIGAACRPVRWKHIVSAETVINLPSIIIGLLVEPWKSFFCRPFHSELGYLFPRWLAHKEKKGRGQAPTSEMAPVQSTGKHEIGQISDYRSHRSHRSLGIRSVRLQLSQLWPFGQSFSSRFRRKRQSFTGNL